MPENLVKLTKRRTRSGTLLHLLGLIKHRLSGQGSNIPYADVGIAGAIRTWSIGGWQNQISVLVQMESI